jgi:YidC/Oxa1 family membrane protein insertase
MQNREGPGQGDTRNIILFVVIAGLILFGSEFFLNGPRRKEEARERAAIAAQQQAREPQAQEEALPARPVTREEALATSAGARIRIDTPSVDGTIALQGARLDDLSLKNFRRTVERDSGEVTLLSPQGAAGAQDAFFGWESRAQGGVSSVADSFSGWTAPEGARLTPQTPVTLTLAAPNGVTIERTIAIDNDFMFTITDRVRNGGTARAELRPFGATRRQDKPEGYKVNQIVHQGMTGVFGPEPRLHEERFENADKHARDRLRGRVGEDERILELTGPGGWLGLADHYWLTALVPDQRERVSAYYDSRSEDGSVAYRAAYRGDWRTLEPGQEVTYTQRLFAGAKRVDLLRTYQKELSIPDFDKAVDWGFFFFLTRPFFMLLDFMGKFAGNFGVGILLTTIVIKLILFPVVYQSNVAMTKLRKVQPKIQEVQQRYAADKQRQQQEMIRLYQTEKINPVAGCVPILLQIPVFYALYKTLTVTIEMRHAPFYGWIHDLSAQDPASVLSLVHHFNGDSIATMLMGMPLIGGLIFAPVLHLSVMAVAYGATMWALQALNPPPADPTQAVIFRWMPILFVFLFASFPVGLVLYWTWSNLLSILQQYVIMRTQGVDTELDKWIAKRLGKDEEAKGVVK